MGSSIAAPDNHFAMGTRTVRHRRRVRSNPLASGEIAALVLITVALIVATVLSSRSACPGVHGERTRIESGQTLWTLASQHPVTGLTTEQTADLIAQMNHIPDGPLAAGSTVRIPAPENHNLALASR